MNFIRFGGRNSLVNLEKVVFIEMHYSTITLYFDLDRDKDAYIRDTFSDIPQAQTIFNDLLKKAGVSDIVSVTKKKGETPIADFSSILSARTINALAADGIRYVEHLQELPLNTIKQIPNLGAKSVRELAALSKKLSFEFPLYKK